MKSGALRRPFLTLPLPLSVVPPSKQPLTPNLKETKQSKSETKWKNISRVVDISPPPRFPRCSDLIPLQNTYFNESEFKRGGKNDLHLHHIEFLGNCELEDSGSFWFSSVHVGRFPPVVQEYLTSTKLGQLAPLLREIGLRLSSDQKGQRQTRLGVILMSPCLKMCLCLATAPWSHSSVEENETTIMCGWKFCLHPEHLGVKWKSGELHNFLKSPHYPICQEAMHIFWVRATM